MEQSPSVEREALPAPRFEVASETRASLLHEDHNDDRCVAREEGLVGVFDGMGGQAGSEEAAEIAAQTLEEAFRDVPFDEDVDTVQSLMHATLMESHRRIRARNTDIGTTATAAKMLRSASGGYFAVIGHVADSRVYRLRAATDELECLTADQGPFTTKSGNEEAEWLDQQALSDVETQEQLDALLAAGPISMNTQFKYRAKLRSGLGGDTEPDIRVSVVELEPGDLLLLTTDGVHDNLVTREIYEEAVDARFKSLHNVVKDIVHMAVWRSYDTRHLRHKPDDVTAAALLVPASPQQ